MDLVYSTSMTSVSSTVHVVPPSMDLESNEWIFDLLSTEPSSELWSSQSLIPLRDLSSMENINHNIINESPKAYGKQGWIPEIGMQFDTVNDAFEFWKAYSKKMGFGVRKEYANKNKKNGIVTNQLFVCYKEGFKKEKENVDLIRQRDATRIGCNARVKVFFDKTTEKYIVRELVLEHNHELQPPITSHMLRSHRDVSTTHALAIELAYESGLTPKTTQELLSREAGGRERLGFIIEDQKTYLRSRRKRDIAKGELGSMFTYFEKKTMSDPKFFYTMQLDCEDNVTNIFWADAKMIADYVAFGDVVTFDTTFGTNRELRPLGVFTGFNHHKQIVVFGATLLYDESIESFSWLFKTFANAHSDKKPRSIFTDQDAAMSKAIMIVWHDVAHGLCTWHIRQNAVKHLSCYMKNKSPFMKDFNRCMYDCVYEDEFENKWKKLLEEYNLKDNDWLSRMYGLKQKWARAYMKNAFTLGIRSTQMSESFNSDLKDHLKSDLNIGDFFKHFDRVVEQKRNKELEAEFQMMQNVPSLGFSRSPLLKQASQRYTLKNFSIFKNEFGLADSVIIKRENQNSHEYVVSLYHSVEKEYKVLCEPKDDGVSCSCSCMKFESEGILCCHVLRVFTQLNILQIPEKYILNRLTRVVRSRHVLDEGKPNEEEDTKDWVRRVQSQLLRLTYQASMNKETQSCIEIMIDECSKKLEKFTIGEEVVKQNMLEEKVNKQMQNIKSLKKKEGQKGKRRMKPLHETRKIKGKKTSKLDPVFDLNLEPSQDFLSCYSLPLPT